MTAAQPAAEIRPNRRREGFTLVELMVVIGIIAILAALITPAVITARTSARNAAIKAEIDMLHMAIMNYKNEYGSFPPCSANPPAYLPGSKHLQRLFPRCTSTALTQQVAALLNPTPAVTLPLIHPSTAVVCWLSGYTDDPASPVIGNRRRLYDFDQARIINNTEANKPGSSLMAGQYYPSGKKRSPYIYIDAAQYGVSPPFTVGAATYPVQLTQAGTPFNPDTFQILCAGLDEEFNTDDDLSNFWPGTRKQYLDSLKQ